MDEKILIEGQYNYINKIKTYVRLLFIITALIGILTITFNILSNSFYDKINDDIYSYGPQFDLYIDDYKLYSDLTNYSIYALIPCVSITVIMFFFYFAIKNTQIVITDKRAYGCALWGKRVDLPLDSISTVATTSNLFKGICIATASGKISFYCVSNRDDIHKEVSNLLIERQNPNNKTNNIPVQNTSNNMDDIIKLKEMLDMGILSQEEFEAKKKQLLGL